MARGDLDRVLSANPVIVYRMERAPPHVVTYVTPNVTDVTGYDAVQFSEPGFWTERIHPDDRAEILAALAALETGNPLEIACRFLHADGVYRWLEGRHRLTPGVDGRPPEISGHWLDVTDSRRLHDEVDRFFRLSLDLLCIRGVDGFFKRINPAFSKILGHSQAELLSRPIQSFLHPDDVEATNRVLSTLTRGSDALTFEDRWRCADGSYRWLEWRAIPYRTEGLIYAVARDVTAERGREAQLRRAKRAADDANRAKSEFLANMSHEIRTPLNGVIGMTELTLDTTLSGQQREYLQIVHNSARALLETINGVLDFSKIEAGKLELEAIDFTLWESVTGALKPLSLAAHEKGVALLYDEDADVPERLHGDPGRLRQAIINLVGNAVKFTAEGSVRLSVSVAGSDGDEIMLRFAVHDTGIGIPADKLDNIFESFAQVDGSMTRRFGGTGLGLPITAGLVELMGGKLTVDSEPGRGSVFTFVARFGREDVPLRAPDLGTLAGVRVLCVHHHADGRRILTDFCERLGMVVTATRSGPAAFEALVTAHEASAPIELVLLDAHLPEMDGFELAEGIRGDRRFADLALVVITASGQPGDGARCRALGIASYLLAPLAPGELRDAIVLSLKSGEGAPATLVTRHSLREARDTLHVLVAEDNRVNQQLATHVLDHFGYTHRVVPNGRAALDALAEEAFDVVLMDIQMPGMDGVEATRRIRRREAEAEDDQHVPIIAMTAHAMPGDEERFRAAGMDAYVAKPVSKERLREVLRSLKRAGSEYDDEEATSDPRPTGRAPTFDRAVLMKRMDSDPRLLRTLVTVFEADYPELLTELEAALASANAEGIERAAHTLKGAISVFGAGPAYAYAQELERMGREGAIAGARDGYGRFRDELGLLASDLEALLAELGAPEPSSP